MLTNKIADYKEVENFKDFLSDILNDELENLKDSRDNMEMYEVEDIQGFINQAINEVLDEELLTEKDDLLNNYNNMKDEIQTYIESKRILEFEKLQGYQLEVLQKVILEMISDALYYHDYTIESRFSTITKERAIIAIKQLDLNTSTIDNIESIINSTVRDSIEMQEKAFIVKDLESVFKHNNLFDIKSLHLTDDTRTIEVVNTYTSQSINVACDSPQAMVKGLMKGLNYA